MDYSIEKVKKNIDKRGELVVFLRNRELSRSGKNFGQIYFITFNGKGVVRGNHYHKKWREWFGIVTGSATVELEDVITKEHVSLRLDAQHSTYLRLEIGPNIAHAFKSLSPRVSLLNYANSEWSVKDRHPYLLIKGGRK